MRTSLSRTASGAATAAVGTLALGGAFVIPLKDHTTLSVVAARNVIKDAIGGTLQSARPASASGSSSSIAWTAGTWQMAGSWYRCGPSSPTGRGRSVLGAAAGHCTVRTDVHRYRAAAAHAQRSRHRQGDPPGPGGARQVLSLEEAGLAPRGGRLREHPEQMATEADEVPLFTVGRLRVMGVTPRRRRARSCERMVAAVKAVPAGQNPVEDEVLHGLSTEQATALAADPSRDQAEVAALHVIAGRDTPAVARKPGESPGAVRVAARRGPRSWPRAGNPSRAGSVAAGTLVADLLDVTQGVAQPGQPGVGVLPGQSYAPGQRVAAATGHARL